MVRWTRGQRDERARRSATHLADRRLPPARRRPRRDGRRRRRSRGRSGSRSSHALDALGPEELTRRFARADQYLRDAGVYYRVYDKAGADERDWPLAHVPLLIDESEWQAITAGLVQRAELFEAIVADIYGENRLVARRPAAAGPDRLQPGIPAAAGRRQAGQRAFPAFLRLRARPRPERRLVGAGRPHAGAVGRRLCAGEPRRHDARAVRHLWRDACPSAGRLLPPLPRRAERHGRRAVGPRRHPDPRPAQRNLLRARLHRPLPRHHAARRRGPHRLRRPADGAHRLRA